jgi:hypothetical protein
MALKYKHKSTELDKLLTGFREISLEEMNAARLMNRQDNKFLLSYDKLMAILPALYANYDILSIHGERNQLYYSRYFDTYDHHMYTSHHNKHANRYKIRQRTYAVSGDSFLEIKHKDNKGTTHKCRVETSKSFAVVPYLYHAFISDNSKYNGLQLKPALDNTFSRFTLTNQKRNQRITIDTNISFKDKHREHTLPNVVVVEVKSTRDDLDKTIFDILHQHQVKPTSFSKYSIGLAMMNPTLKQNLFKEKITKINRLNHAV